MHFDIVFICVLRCINVRSGPGPSRLSIVSTAASENQVNDLDLPSTAGLNLVSNEELPPTPDAAPPENSSSPLNNDPNHIRDAAMDVDVVVSVDEEGNEEVNGNGNEDVDKDVNGDGDGDGDEGVNENEDVNKDVNEIINMDVDAEEPAGPPPNETDPASRGPTPPLVPPDQSSIPEADSTISPKIFRNADGTIVIEELDTPATRREKNRRKGKKHATQASNNDGPAHVNVLSEPAPASTDGSPHVQRRAGTSKSKKGLIEGESDLSSLSEEGGNTSSKGPPAVKKGKIEGGYLGLFCLFILWPSFTECIPAPSLGQSWSVNRHVYTFSDLNCFFRRISLVARCRI